MADDYKWWTHYEGFLRLQRLPLIAYFYYEKELFYIFSKGKLTPDGGGATSCFWRINLLKRLYREYVPLLQKRQEWTNSRRNLVVGDIVLVADETNPRSCWPFARMIKVIPVSDGFVRRVKVKTKTTVRTFGGY